jgi:TfoX/Sxy family transcriptional regulator of competence genes
VAYDEDLADRIRALLADETGVSERSMFGGRAFLLHGNLAIAASRQGGVLVRAGDAADRLVARSSAEVAIMRGRPMTGWLRVPAEDLRTKRQLARWVTIGADVARALPRKPPKRRGRK